jgi:hypothetical protein
MTSKLEMYVRATHDGTLLTTYASSEIKGSLEKLTQGEVYAGGATLELSVLPEWITDAEERRRFVESGLSLHVRIPLDRVHLGHVDED